MAFSYMPENMAQAGCLGEVQWPKLTKYKVVLLLACGGDVKLQPYISYCVD